MLQFYILFCFKGLFTWARLSGLARFPRSRFFQPGSRYYWDPGWKNAWSGLKIFPHKHVIPVTGMKAVWILTARMASSCIACWIFHIMSIPFNCSDTALRVVDTMMGAKVIIFVFRHVCFVSRISRQNSSPGSLFFVSSRKPGWNFSHESKAKLVPITGPARSTGLMWRGPKFKWT